MKQDRKVIECHHHNVRATLVTDCLAYLNFLLLIPSSRFALIRDSGPLCPLLTNLPMDCSCVF